MQSVMPVKTCSECLTRLAFSQDLLIEHCSMEQCFIGKLIDIQPVLGQLCQRFSKFSQYRPYSFWRYDYQYGSNNKMLVFDYIIM